MNCKSSHIKPTAYIKKNNKFRVNKNLTDKLYKVDEPSKYQLDEIIREISDDCLHYFQRLFASFL